MVGAWGSEARPDEAEEKTLSGYTVNKWDLTHKRH